MEIQRPKIRLLFKERGIPEELWGQIFLLLDVKSLQESSQVCKKFRYFILKYVAKSEIFFPDENNLVSPLFEIEMKMAKKLVIEKLKFSRTWTNKVLQCMPNITTVELTTDKINKPVAVKLFRCLERRTRIDTIVVSPAKYAQWRKIKETFANNEINITMNNRNSLLVGVIEESIPRATLPFGSNNDAVLEKFSRYRNGCIDKLKTVPRLSGPVEALSLNSIIYIGSSNNNMYDIDETLWNTFKDDYENALFADLLITHDRDLSAVKSIVDQFARFYKNRPSGNFDDIDEVLSSIRSGNNNSSKIVERTFLLITGLASKLSPYWIPKDMSEDSFTMNVFDPIVSVFIRKVHNAIYHGADHELTESKIRKRKYLGNQAVGRKPDRSIELVVRNKSYHMFNCEIKTEQKSRNRPDFVKMATMMKDCLDIALLDGYDRMKFFEVGLLQEGITTTIFTMSSPVNHVYCLQEVSKFSMPESINHLEALVDVIIGLDNCRKLILNSANVLRTTEENTLNSYRRWYSSLSPKHHAEYYS